MRRGVSPHILVLVAAIAAAIAAGCTRDASDPLQRIPDEATLVVRIDTRLGEGGAWDAAQQLARRLPAFALVEQDLQPQRLIDRMSQRTGTQELDWERDIEPWIGDSAGAALLDDDLRSERWIVWIETDDEDAAERAAERALGDRGEADGGGVSVTRGRESFYAVDGGDLFISPSEETLRDVLATSEEESISSDDVYRSHARRLNAKDRLITAYARPVHPLGNQKTTAVAAGTSPNFAWLQLVQTGWVFSEDGGDIPFMPFFRNPADAVPRPIAHWITPTPEWQLLRATLTRPDALFGGAQPGEARRAQYRQDVDTVGAPGDPTEVTWFDLQRAAESAVGPMSPLEEELVRQQLEHIGGIVIWGEREDEAAELNARLPVYD